MRLAIVNLRQSETRLHKSSRHKFKFLVEIVAAKVFFNPLLEPYSAFKVENIQDFDNGKCSRGWRMVLCRFLPPEFGNFTNFPVAELAPRAKLGLQIHCYCNLSSDFANVRASKIPQDQSKLVLNLLVAERGGRES